MDEKEYSNVYAIPANYTDSGKLFGGMLEVRNTVETGLLLLIVGYPELAWISVSAAAKTVIAVVTLLPLCVLGLIGISGDSLSSYVWRMILFRARRRKLHLRRVGYRYESRKAPKTRRKHKRRDS
jgi:hypothetical protein